MSQGRLATSPPDVAPSMIKRAAEKRAGHRSTIVGFSSARGSRSRGSRVSAQKRSDEEPLRQSGVKVRRASNAQPSRRRVWFSASCLDAAAADPGSSGWRHPRKAWQSVPEASLSAFSASSGTLSPKNVGVGRPPACPLCIGAARISGPLRTPWISVDVSSDGSYEGAGVGSRMCSCPQRMKARVDAGGHSAPPGQPTDSSRAAASKLFDPLVQEWPLRSAPSAMQRAVGQERWSQPPSAYSRRAAA